MKGDFSRDTFDVTKHFSRVLLQQGKVQLDADWNEQTAILLHYLRTLAADIIGPFGGPAGSDYGFEVIRNAAGMVTRDFAIGMGRYYVDGILCENGQNDLTYQNQKTDYPNPVPLVAGSDYLVYLDVWERHITALEDDYIREKALGGPDTASRAKVVCQVKVEDSVPDGLYLNQSLRVPANWQRWVEGWQSNHRGCLRARVKPSAKSNDPCLTAPDAKYRGPENQLYRIEVHQAAKGDKPATFKWSRDNGSVVTACTKVGLELNVDSARGFDAPGWVELTNEGLELRSQPGALAKVVKVEGDVLTLESDPAKPSGVPGNEIWPTKVRRWDHGEKNKLIGGTEKSIFDGDSHTLLVCEGSSDSDWIELEHGVQIQFYPASAASEHNYRSGDYWLVPARVATGGIEWPLETDYNGVPVLKNGQTIPLPRPPHGIHHHYAPLAILTANNDHWFGIDLRCRFLPLNNNCGLSYSYGEEGIGGHLLCNPPEELNP